jgi:hypothetical protein
MKPQKPKAESQEAPKAQNQKSQKKTKACKSQETPSALPSFFPSISSALACFRALLSPPCLYFPFLYVCLGRLITPHLASVSKPDAGCQLTFIHCKHIQANVLRLGFTVLLKTLDPFGRFRIKRLFRQPSTPTISWLLAVHGIANL